MKYKFVLFKIQNCNIYKITSSAKANDKSDLFFL